MGFMYTKSELELPSSTMFRLQKNRLCAVRGVKHEHKIFYKQIFLHAKNMYSVQ